jgi:Zn-dependent protease
MTLFVIEKIEPLQTRKLFTLLRTDYRATSRSWMAVPLLGGVGIALALLFAPSDQLPVQLAAGLGYGLLIYVAMFTHGVGHIISSRMVDGPVTTVIMTSTVMVTHYEDASEQPRRIHVGRAIGGPLASFVLGVVAIALFYFIVPQQFLLFAGIVSILFGLLTAMPIPSLDGAVILRELRRNRP